MYLCTQPSWWGYTIAGVRPTFASSKKIVDNGDWPNYKFPQADYFYDFAVFAESDSELDFDWNVVSRSKPLFFR